MPGLSASGSSPEAVFSFFLPESGKRKRTPMEPWQPSILFVRRGSESSIFFLGFVACLVTQLMLRAQGVVFTRGVAYQSVRPLLNLDRDAWSFPSSAMLMKWGAMLMLYWLVRRQELRKSYIRNQTCASRESYEWPWVKIRIVPPPVNIPIQPLKLVLKWVVNSPTISKMGSQNGFGPQPNGARASFCLVLDETVPRFVFVRPVARLSCGSSFLQAVGQLLTRLAHQEALGSNHRCPFHR